MSNSLFVVHPTHSTPEIVSMDMNIKYQFYSLLSADIFVFLMFGYKYQVGGYASSGLVSHPA